MRPRSLPVLTLVALAIVLLPALGAALLRAGGPAAPPPRGAERLEAGVPYDLGVAITPGTWTMFPGDSVDLVTAPVDLPGDCDLVASWFSWVLLGGSFARGFLNRSSGASVALTALPNASGAIGVEVTAVYSVLCDDGSSADIEPQAEATVRLLPGLAVAGPSVTPAAAAPGTPSSVAWTVEGGQPPYAIAVDFGDGNVTTVAQPSEGNGSIAHLFGPGEFVVALTVADARRDLANASDPVAVLRDPGLVLALATAGAGAEVGRALRVNATVQGGFGESVATWTVNGTPVPGEGPGGAPYLTLTPTAAGPLPIALRLEDALGETASANLSVLVHPAPTVSLAPLAHGADVARPVLVTGVVDGGVGPFVVRYAVLPNGSNLTASVAGDGAFRLPVVPPVPGPLLVGVEVTDATGAATSGSFDLGTVGLPPEITIVGPPSPVEAGRPADFAVRLAGGAGPYDWAVRADPGLAGGMLPAGTAPGPSALTVDGIPSTAGNLTISAMAVDAFGAIATANASLPVLPALSLTVTVVNLTGGGGVGVYARCAGGLPPYALRASVGGISVSVVNLTGPGAYTVRVPGATPGFEPLTVELDDAAGANASSSATVFVAPAPVPGASPSAPTSEGAGPTVPGWVAGAALLPLAVVPGYLLVRRRGAGARAPGARALAMVRRSTQGEEGIDEETLGFLAAEEGIDGASLRGAVDRWTRLGRLRRDEDPVAGPVLRWVPLPPPPAGLGEEAA